jgi:two-component system cell cycle response regulator
MQVNNMRKEHPNVQDMPSQPVLFVCALGFGATLEEKLNQLFRQQPLYKTSFRLVSATASAIDVLLVNYDNPLALRKKDLLINGFCANAAIVGVSQGALDNPPAFHIQGLLSAGKLMAMLDNLPLPDAAQNRRPLATVLAHPARPATLSPAAMTGPVKADDKPRYRALVVDDSLAIQKSLELHLKTLEQIDGVDFADNGVTALAMAEANQYDLIFLDVMMAGMDGYETCTQLRNNPRYKKTPIIMVSGKTSPLDEVKGVMAGCSTYLTKPVQPLAFQKLSIRVVEWLTSRQEQNPQPNPSIVKH